MSERQAIAGPPRPGSSRREAPWDVVDLFSRTANRQPRTDAVEAEDGFTLSYLRLDRWANRLARHLIDHGIGRERVVAVSLERSAESIVAFLAVLKAGAAYLPVDVDLPDARRSALIEASGAVALVTDATAWTCAPPDCAVVRLDEDRHRIAALEAEAPRAEILAEQLAYVIFTSGSTGSPKAVAVSHRSLFRLIEWQCRQGPETPRTVQFAPCGFDVWIQEVLSTLCGGGTLHVIGGRLRRDPARLLGYVAKHRIQRLFLPYVALQGVAEAIARAPEPPGSLRQVITAGERLKITPALRAAFSRASRARLDNHYGPTETHLATSYTLPPAPSAWPELPSIGHAIDGTTVQLLDGELKPVSSEARGEIHVGGEAPARGYLGDPRLTAERFVPDPCAAEAGARTYRTGDVARREPDGGLRFEGRIDRQLKIRGFRVEPAEVEAALATFPAVRLAAVDAREGEAGVTRLVAYVIAQPGEPLSRDALRAHLSRRLPDYMVPGVFVALDDLPLTASGKVDRRKLARAPLGEPSPAAEKSPGAGADLEERLMEVWQRVLELDEIETDDDFFEIGGDSLLAARLVAEAAAALDREVPLASLLDECTIEGMVEALEDGEVPAATSPTAPARTPFRTVELRATGEATPLFLVHPLGGEALCYRDLVRALTVPRPVHGLLLSGDSDDAPTLETLAAAHLEQVRRILPEGPVALAGWSFGGVVAYEMAVRLREAGAPVESLVLIDANPGIDPTSGKGIDDQPVLAELEAFLAELDGAAPETEDSLRHTFSRRFATVLGGDLPRGVDLAHVRRYFETALTCLRAAVAYRAPLYPAPVHLLQAGAASAPIQHACRAALEALTAGRVQVHEVPGDHHALLRPPFVQATATTLEHCLAAGADSRRARTDFIRHKET